MSDQQFFSFRHDVNGAFGDFAKQLIERGLAAHSQQGDLHTFTLLLNATETAARTNPDFKTDFKTAQEGAEETK